MAGIAGCVGDSQSPENSDDSQSPEDSQSSEDPDDPQLPEDFETCGAVTININALPDPARTEVETALEDSQYETEKELYLPHLMDIDTTSLIPGSGSYRQAEIAYRALVNQDGATTTLKLEEATPSIGVSGFELVNRTDTEQTVTAHLERESPDIDVDEMETIFEETDTIPPQEVIEIGRFERYFVDHRVKAETENITEIIEWAEKGLMGSVGGVMITDEEILAEPRPMAELEDCRDVWERAITSG